MPQLQSASELMERTRSLLGDSLAQVEGIFEGEISSENPFVRDIIAHTRRFRGKRLRPILCLLTAQANGGIQHEHLILAAVVEMIHTATLVHDDVLDEADVRRHVATVNVRWNNETSVLYGDYLFTHAFHLASTTGSAEACRIIGQATNRVCEGELTQIRNRGNCELTEAEYFSIIDGKTAELCAVACLIGAQFSGADELTVRRLEQFGRLLGQAFQIADDVLDLVGMETSVGKTLGTDLQQQKMTLPIIRLLQSCDEERRRQLIALIEEGTETAARELVGLARELGAIEETLLTARQLADQAREAMDCLPDSPAKELLAQLPLMSIERNC